MITPQARIERMSENTTMTLESPDFEQFGTLGSEKVFRVSEGIWKIEAKTFIQRDNVFFHTEESFSGFTFSDVVSKCYDWWQKVHQIET